MVFTHKLRTIYMLITWCIHVYRNQLHSVYISITYQSPDPEADNWMTKAATCRLYELVPTPRLYVCPITAILGKVPMVRAGNTGTIPFSVRGRERAYYPGGKCDSAPDKGDGSRLWYINTWAMKWSQKE